MYCRHCGQHIDDDSIYCPYCGQVVRDDYKLEEITPPDSGYISYTDKKPPVSGDKYPIGWMILSFLFPLVGLICFIRWNNTKPNHAMACLLIGIVSFLMNIGVYYFIW